MDLLNDLGRRLEHLSVLDLLLPLSNMCILLSFERFFSRLAVHVVDAIVTHDFHFVYCVLAALYLDSLLVLRYKCLVQVDVALLGLDAFAWHGLQLCENEWGSC